MTHTPTLDRFLPLDDLHYYPGSPYLERTIQLLWSENQARRVWLLTPNSAPTLHLEDVVLKPQHISEQPVRWIDYGVANMTFMDREYPIWEGLIPVRLEGLSLADCKETYLVITTKLEVSLAGCTVEEAQRKLWGLSQRDAGFTSLHPTSATVGQPVLFAVRYAAGPHGLPAGAIIRFIVPSGLSEPQTEKPDTPGYVSITQADCEVDIVTIRNTLETQRLTSILCQLKSALAPGEGLTLQYQVAETFIFPAVMDEVEMRTWYSLLPPLTASVALTEDTPFVNMLPENGHAFQLVPGASQQVHLFLPGRRYASEALTLKGTFTDKYRNVPPLDPIDSDFELWLVKGEEETALGTPAGHFVARHRFEIPLPSLIPGVYRVYARRRDSGEEVTRSNPLEIIPDGAGERLYWGEIHSHTELGDGGGDFEGVFRHAKDEGCLEFATVSEHAEYFTDNQWQWMQDVINAWNDEGRFVTLVGYEFIGEQKDRIVYTSRPRLDLMRGYYQATRTLDTVWGHFHGDEEVVGGPHATMSHKTKWEHHDPEIERFIEIYSMWGACDFRQGPLVVYWMEEGRGLTVNEILQQGAKLGFTAGGDCHDGRVGFASEDREKQGRIPHTNGATILYPCGMMAANMPELGRKDLIRALRNRHTYGTTGARILVDFSVSGFPMGAIGQAPAVECRATIHAVAPLQTVEIIKDGEVVWTQAVEGLDVNIAWRDPNPPTKEHYYYLHLIQEDFQQAWASPVWISPE